MALTLGQQINPISDDSWKKVTNRELLEKRVRALRAEADHWDTVLATFNPAVLNMTQEECQNLGFNCHFYKAEAF